MQTSNHQMIETILPTLQNYQITMETYNTSQSQMETDNTSQLQMETDNTSQLQMETDNISQLQMTVKEEIDHMLIEENDVTMAIKTENCASVRTEDSLTDNTENPFENIQLEVKKEVNFSINFEKDTNQHTDVDTTLIPDKIEPGKDIQTENPDTETEILSSNIQIDIKEEVQMDEPLITCDYPDLNDENSMDSNEATALGNVEACLQDEIDIKCENVNHYNSNPDQGPSTAVKIESELMSTETPFITNNNASSAYNIQDSDIPSSSETSSFMELLGMRKITDDGLLPNVVNNSKSGEYQRKRLKPSLVEAYGTDDNGDLESFQLNSITGNILSLEQEAYGLLEAKRKTKAKIFNNGCDKPFICPECPKTYRTKANLSTHLGVHRSIERYAMGIIKGKLTRKKNQKKKIMSEKKECVTKEPLSKKKERVTSIERYAMGVITGRLTRRENQKKKILFEKKECITKEPISKKQESVTSIERYAMGVIQRKLTRKENRKKKITAEKKECGTKEPMSKKQEMVNSIETCAMDVIKGKHTRKQNQKKKTITENKECVTKQPLSKKKESVTKERMSKKKESVAKEPVSKKTESVTKEPISTKKECITQELKPDKVIKKEGYECTCGKAFQRRSRMETCLRSHNLFEGHTNCVSCMTCTRQFINKDELALHRKRLHRKKFPCKFCPTDYDTRKELFKHLQIHQKVQLMEYKVISEVIKKKKKLRCFMCSKSWSELSELKMHVMNVHKGPYVCPHCKNTFPKILDFGNHTKTYHPKVENKSVLDVLEAFSRLVQAWKCEECELQFFEVDKLALHQIEKHNPDLKADPQFQCSDCRRVFISQKGLTSHRRIHHSIETREEVKEVETGIMCLECRKICKDITALTSHMRLHSPDRKYPCKFCDFRFATPEKRKSHAEVHTGDMKYVCFICEYQCSSENRLKLHKISLKHVNMKEYLLTGKPLIPEESTAKPEKEKVKKENNSVKKRKKDKVEDKDKVEEKDKIEEKEDVGGSDTDSSSSSDCEVTCDICGENFSKESKMLEHKQTHPFIEFPNDDKPSRIFFK